MENQIHKNKMGHKPMFKLIISMSIPAIFSMMVLALYNVVDCIFVSWYSEDGLIAITLTLPIQMIIIALGVGTGIGINSLIARRLGEKRFDDANQAAAHGLLLSVINWAFVAILSLFIVHPFLTLYSDNPEIIMMGEQYIYVMMLFSFGVFVQVNCEKILQATGNMIYPMVFQLIGAIINIILDPIFIFGLFGVPELGVLGSAIATVIGQCTSMAFSLMVLFNGKHEVSPTFKGFKLNFSIIKNIYQVGFPSIIMQSIASVMLMGMNAILAGFSEIAIAVLGVYFRLQSFVFMPVFGLCQGIMPIMGYNYGAKNKGRLLSAVKIGSLIAIAIMAAGTTLFLIFPEILLKLFNASPELMNMGTIALRIISVGFVLAAIGITMSVFYQAIGRGTVSLFISALRQLFVILPAAYLLAGISVNYVWWSFPIAELAATGASLIVFKRIYDKEIAHMGKD